MFALTRQRELDETIVSHRATTTKLEESLRKVEGELRQANRRAAELEAALNEKADREKSVRLVAMSC